MKSFTEFLEEFERTNEPVDEHVFNGEQVKPETHSKTKPIFAKSINEEGAPVSGMTAPSVSAGPNSGPGPILAPGSDCVIPTIINGNAPVHCPHGPHHRPPPPPPPFRRYLHLVAPIGRAIIAKKKKSKKRRSKRKQPKNPYK